MTHQVVIIGAGYAGLGAATRLARTTRGTEVRSTLVSADEHFVERVRLHQLATGQPLREHRIREVLAGSAVDFVAGTVTGLDPGHRTVTSSAGVLGYDTLVYALGSGGTPNTIPGVAEHALSIGTAVAATRTAQRLQGLARGRVLVVGGGLTGIELAAEIADLRPELDVRLCCIPAPGHWLSRPARRHLHQALQRLGITTHLGRVTAVTPTSVELEDGRTVDCDATVWAAGFSVPTLARTAGVAVDDTGRILVDDTLRSISHPEIHAVGDAAVATTAAGQPTRMACQTALPMGKYVAGAIRRQLSGRTPGPHRVRYVWQNISLGRHDGVTQFTRLDDSPLRLAMTGRASARFKELISRGAVWYAIGR